MSPEQFDHLLEKMDEVEKVRVVYHRVDIDGRLSAAVVLSWLHQLEEFRLNRFDDVQLFGVNYGEEIPKFDLGPDTAVFLVDFSYPLVTMQEWKERLGLFVWFDHHASAIELTREYGFDPLGTRTERFAACELVWDGLMGGLYHHHGNLPEAPPQAVVMASRYDRWDTPGPFWPLDDPAYVFQIGLRLQDLTDPTFPSPPDCRRAHAILNPLWSGLLLYRTWGAPTYSSVLEEGREAVEKQAKDWKSLMGRSFTLKWEGFNWLAINVSGLSSQAFAEAFDPETQDGMMFFSFGSGNDGSVGWTVSLRSYDKEKNPVRPIAEKYGGGGHPAAAGFRCSSLPFDLEKARGRI